jgi:hypothetical protein
MYDIISLRINVYYNKHYSVLQDFDLFMEFKYGPHHSVDNYIKLDDDTACPFYEWSIKDDPDQLPYIFQQLIDLKIKKTEDIPNELLVDNKYPFEIVFKELLF